MSQQGAPGQPGGERPMYRPEQMRNLTILPEAERQTFERGLTMLWNQYNAAPENSAEKAAFKKKIVDFGPVLAKKVNERKLQAQQQAQQAQQAGQQQGQPQQAGQPTAQDGQPKPPTTNPNPQAATAALAAAQQKGPGMIQMPPAPTAQQMAGASQQGQQNAQPQQGGGLSQSIRSHLAKMTFNPPPNIVSQGPEAAAKWSNEAKRKYAQSLVNMENSKNQLGKLNGMVKDRTEKNQPLSADEQKMYTEKKAQIGKVYEDANRFVDMFRKSQGLGPRPNANGAQGATGANAGAGGAGGAAGAGAAPGQGPRPGGPQQQPMKQEPSNQGMMAGVQGSQADINAAFEAAKKESLAAAGRMQGATGLPSGLQQQPQANGGQGAMASPGGQAQIKIEPGTQARPHPPPINTQIAAGTPGSAPNTANLMARAQAASLPHQMQDQQQQQQRVQTPQSAAQQATHPGLPRAFSHQKALEEANNRARATSQSGPASAPGGAPANVPSAGTPQSGGANSAGAGVIGTVPQQSQPQQPQQQGSHPHAHPTGQQMQAKLPIPKQLPERATQLPNPVALGGGMTPGRPTMTGGSGIAGGVMGQPAVARIPPVTMEGDVERVLNKKKLDELVRQVCGGTAEDQEQNLLQPEVEESVLNLADSFVDNVLHAACRNAKERGSKVLEIRDIQLVLERSYNIRIPGFSADELRTVRKVQPSPAWISKMSAVQAAKVTQGKGDV